MVTGVFKKNRKCMFQLEMQIMMARLIGSSELDFLVHTGAQGTITISIGGSGGSALSGSFSMRPAQAATSAPEVAPHHLPAHTLVLEGSGGSLIKVCPHISACTTTDAQGNTASSAGTRCRDQHGLKLSGRLKQEKCCMQEGAVADMCSP